MADDSTTRRLEILIERLKAGDDSARWELLERSFERLRGLSGRILGDFPRIKEDVAWQTTDVAMEVRLRLSKALQEIQLADPQHFFRLAAQKIRYLLLDLVKRLPTREPTPPEKASPGQPVVQRQEYQDATIRLLELLSELPEEEFAVLDLEFSLGFETAAIAAALGVDERTVRRRRRRAYDALHRELSGEFPWLLGKTVTDQE